MEITAELVRHMADLSRLELGAEEAQETAALMERALGYMEVLGELDSQPLDHASPAGDALREDEPVPSWDRGELLAGAPASDSETFLVPRTVG